MRGSEEEPGVIPSAIDEIFETISKSAGREFLLRVSYMELYNEEIRDLLNPSKCKLQLHEDAVRGIYVAGLHEEIVNDAEQIKKLMEKGENSRHVGETNMNSRSSRSHTIFKMVIESRDCSQDQVCVCVYILGLRTAFFLIYTEFDADLPFRPHLTLFTTSSQAFCAVVWHTRTPFIAVSADLRQSNGNDTNRITNRAL
jgi:hypothetical protein